MSKENLSLEDLKNSLLESHPLGIKGIFRVYSIKKILKTLPFWISILYSSSFSFIAIYFLNEADRFKLILDLIDVLIAVFPNLLGFNLGGYALIIGFGNTELLESMVEEKNGKSLYQTINSIFAFSILIQCATLLLVFFSQAISKIPFQIGQSYADIVNCFAIAILNFFASWSILLIPYIVVNVFTFGQLHHFHLSIKKLTPKDPNKPCDGNE